ncbi:hypothetical protein PENARI_c043G07096 [Penicillium arizonense]|uniref:Uncharacterized protein n=1 Tax=Penicillium arizonense TaxID=1835702 RepID=A0A1F5L3J2_PENAI|nr:hypothetical protein PENARI_c043G07096 [Penicillium arizonense]OGE47491.1 hypothetical protein PENARI_c043G07096 [Penicillium arizonense]
MALVVLLQTSNPPSRMQLRMIRLAMTGHLTFSLQADSTNNLAVYENTALARRNIGSSRCLQIFRLERRQTPSEDNGGHPLDARDPSRN